MEKNTYTTINGYRFTFHPRAKAPGAFRGYESLSECYNHYSNAKLNAYRYCVDMCDSLHGFNFAITSYNCMMFTVMFDFYHPVTGELMRVHITRDYNHLYFI